MLSVISVRAMWIPLALAGVLAPVATGESPNQSPRVAWALPSAHLNGDDGSGCSFLYRQGRCYKVADIAGLPLLWHGASTTGFDTGLRLHEENFALQFRAQLRVPQVGTYTFWLRSDDGSQLRIGSTLVVNNDFDHGMTERSGTITLAAGDVPIAVDFYNAGGPYGLEVSWSGPGFERALIPRTALRRATDVQPDSVVAAATSWKRLIAPGAVDLPVVARDADGSVERVDIQLNGVPMAPLRQAPYQVSLRDLTAGVYELTARAVDQLGAVSAPSRFVVEVLAGPASDGSAAAHLVAGVPGQSRVSPISIEGFEVTGRGASVWGPTGSVPSRRLAPNRFLAEVPLNPGATSLVRVGDGQREIIQDVEWLPTPVDGSLPGLAIRRGDSLLMQGPPDGRLMRTHGYDDPVVVGTFSPGGLLVIDLPDPGTFAFQAQFPDQRVAGTQTVIVYGCDPLGPTACSMHFERRKSVRVLGGPSTGVWVGSSRPSALSVRRAAYAEESVFLALRPTNVGGAYVLRLGDQDGPMLFAGAVDAFTASYSASTKFSLVGSYPDGTRIGAGSITMRPWVPGVDVQLSLWGSGTSFMDGTTASWLSTSTFDRSGTAGVGTYEIVIEATRTGHICHAIRFYQAGFAISN